MTGSREKQLRKKRGSKEGRKRNLTRILKVKPYMKRGTNVFI